MGVMDNIRSGIVNWLMPEALFDTSFRHRLHKQQELYDYYSGAQRRQMKVKVGQADDNLTLNYVDLVVERSLSMLLGGGVQFDLGSEGDESSPEQQYIDNIWRANRGDILLHRAAQYAGVFGTGYMKIIPDGIEYQGELYPRLVPLDPRWMQIHTAVEDMDRIRAYDMRYNVQDGDEEIARRELTEHVPSEGEGGSDMWLIIRYMASRHTSGKWQEIDRQEWAYDFPPIEHWQNLPMPGSVYGKSDIGNIIELQDRINFVSSNISRIIRYHAHPKTWGRQAGNMTKASWGPDEMIIYNSPDAMIENLEMQSDLNSSQQYLLSLRQSLFDISRTVDISSMADKLGALTNFGLRVLYTDSLAKLHTKQSLFGEALEKLNHRMLVIGEFTDTSPGKVLWPDNMPRDSKADLEADQLELATGTVSKQTIATENGRDWEQEQERLSEEQAAGGNIGNALIEAFNRGL